jgi:hypothetical protein
MKGYNSQIWGTARTSKLVNFFIAMYVPFSVFCVLFVCKCVLHYCQTQLQLNINNNNHNNTNTLTICNTHCSSTTTLVARTRLNVTSYVHYPPCILYLHYKSDFKNNRQTDRHTVNTVCNNSDLTFHKDNLHILFKKL